MTGRLELKVAIVTGASSGIGRAIALRYHEEGAFVVCSDINAKAKDKSEQDISTHEFIIKDGGKAIFVKCDVRSEEEVEALIRQAVEEFGRLDIMVNNAGIASEASHPMPLWEQSLSNLETTLNVNTKGVFLGLKHAVRQMLAQEPHLNGDRGCVVNTASIFGLVGVAGSACYVASKHAVMGLTKSAALECAKHKIRVNALCPGFTMSAMTDDFMKNKPVALHYSTLHPLGGYARPKDLTGAAVFLASDDASWMCGQGLTVDGGFTAQ
ncbi:NAD(P)-binding protein [Pseudovirgaria hyperparasitica]|uniref:NAD(P)-binding protein n=1 Tax=Pseudovirgaria hyperparasitica TaxID=470096 RepID=A0A6A6WHU0_9PEZI|nr:NAD(P)-binding protein [Pseudovirgaria hyperparasitica]KAF2762372.1 NAD(P)-binding protein [Pseudovirgaria hyperparasitica]